MVTERIPNQEERVLLGAPSVTWILCDNQGETSRRGQGSENQNQTQAQVERLEGLNHEDGRMDSALSTEQFLWLACTLRAFNFIIQGL